MASHFNDLSRCISKFTGWAIIELSKRRGLHTFLISRGQKTRVKHCYVDLSSWYDFWFAIMCIYLAFSNNFRDSFNCLVNGSTRRIFFIEIRQGKILAPMYLCQGKMWKSNVKNIFPIPCWPVGVSNHVVQRGVSWLRKHLPLSAHSRQSKRQNIIDRTHTWQQCLVTISEDILTTKYGFNLR